MKKSTKLEIVRNFIILSWIKSCFMTLSINLYLIFLTQDQTYDNVL